MNEYLAFQLYIQVFWKVVLVYSVLYITRGVTIRLATIRYISRYTTHDMVHDTIQNQLIYYHWKILKHCGMCHQYCYIKTVILARNSEFKINKDVHNHPCPKYLLLTRVGFLPEETYFFQDTRKKVEETYFFRFCPDKTGRNWTKLEQGKSEGFESCDRPIVRKRPIRVKSGDVLSRVTLKFDGWLWKTIGHLSFAVSSFVQHFITISEFKLELLSRNAQFR